jgi:hypothetical protein
MRRKLGFAAAVILVSAALASPQASQATTCLQQCMNERLACNAACHVKTCIADCSDQYTICRSFC